MEGPTYEDHVVNAQIKTGLGEITISDINKDKDEGYYECVATDVSMKQTSDRIFIEILGKSLFT